MKEATPAKRSATTEASMQSPVRMAEGTGPILSKAAPRKILAKIITVMTRLMAVEAVSGE